MHICISSKGPLLNLASICVLSHSVAERQGELVFLMTELLSLQMETISRFPRGSKTLFLVS